jgi:hypothetical protein
VGGYSNCQYLQSSQQQLMMISASPPKELPFFEASVRHLESLSAELYSRTNSIDILTEPSQMEPYQKNVLSLVPKPLVLMKLLGHFPEHVISAYRYVYADSLRTVWYVTTWIAAAGFLVSFLVKNESMDRGQ